jgi:hypothetical protein
VGGIIYICLPTITITNININNKMVTTRNHDLFEWKIKQKTNHLTFGQFDHLVMYWTSRFEHVQLDCWLFWLTIKWSLWLIKSNKKLSSQKKLIKKKFNL